MNTLNEITITLSVEQLYLINILTSQSNKYILSHLKTKYIPVVQSEKIQSKFISESLTYDSGIHSTEDNKCFDQENSTISLVDNKINPNSNKTFLTKK